MCVRTLHLAEHESTHAGPWVSLAYISLLLGNTSGPALLRRETGKHCFPDHVHEWLKERYPFRLNL